jgi:hypothetical protein
MNKEKYLAEISLMDEKSSKIDNNIIKIVTV